MGAGDDSEKNELEDASGGNTEDVNKTDGALESEEDVAFPNALTGEVFLEAANSSHPLLWANFAAWYTWSPNGRSLELSNFKYSARDNGRKKGNVNIRLQSAADTGWRELTTNGDQNAEWHEIPGTLTVAGDVNSVVVHYDYTYDLNNVGDPHLGANKTYRFIPAAPVITGPQGYVSDLLVTVSGIGAAFADGTVTVHNANGDGVLGPVANLSENGIWATTINMPSGLETLTFYAIQKIGNAISGKSNQKTIDWAPTTLTEPAANAIVLADQLVFKGRGFPGNRIWAVFPNVGTELSERASVNTNKTWQAGGKLLASGRWSAQAAYQSGSEPIRYTEEHRSFTVLGKPSITRSTATKDMSFTVYGTNGMDGASVEVRLDVIGTPVGKGTAATNGSWNARVKVPPGMISLVAEQTYQIASGLSTAQAFKVRPPKLTAVTVTTPTDTSVKFEGDGYTGATVQITVVSGPNVTAPAPAPVNAGSWNTTATNWPFGSYSLRAIQRFPDGANGWIDSQPYTFPVNLILPDPTDITYTPVYQPVFSGKGFNGATVMLFNPGGASKVAPDAGVSSGQWQSRASEVWGPTFKRKVHIKQYLNGAPSPTWQEIEVTIPPLAPVMNVPVENGLSPNLNGTCWPDAVLTLTFSDSTTEHPVENNNGTWNFRRTEPFAPEVIHTATLIQTAAQQPSPAASRTFTVVLPMRQPVITDPIPNAEVGRELIVRGREGMAEASMQVRDAQFQTDLGEPKVLTADGEWSVELPVLAFRRYTIDAQQTLRGGPSERSETVTFEVVVLPPVFDVPQPGSDLPRTMVLSGTGMPGGRVDVWLLGASEPLIEDIFVGAEGWKAEVTLPVGETTILARQRFEGRTSKDTAPLTFNVVPAAPFIETPATDEHIGRRVVVSGFGVPGDTVTVKLGDAALTVLGDSPVLEDRTWSVTVAFDHPGGLYDLMAVASSEGFHSADSPPRPVVLGTYRPSIDVPVAGGWVDNPVNFEGQGRPGVGQVVSWFNPDQVWATGLPVAASGWEGGASQALSAGGNWCRFRQTITDTVDGATASDWVESRRFEVLLPTRPTQVPNSR
ncbi:hypothetical protein PHLH3_47780 [Pseudomonas sp. St386]|nr:hypothetical protein PHLH3_47780 [Pseudomonas sp. St386]